MRRYAPLFVHIARQRRLLAIIVGLTLLASFSVAIQPWPVKLLIDGAIGGEQIPWVSDFVGGSSTADTTTRLVMLAVVASLLTFVLSSGLTAALDWAWTLAGNRMVVSLSTAMFDHAQRLSPRFHAGRGVGDLLDRLSADTYSIYTASSSLLVTPLRQLAVLLSVSVLAWTIHPQLALVSLLIAPFLGASAMYFGDRLEARTESNREAQSRVMTFVHQTLASIPMVQAFDTGSRNTARFGVLADEVVGHTQRTALLNTSSTMLNGTISALGAAVVLFLGSREILAGRLSIGSLLVFLAYLTTLQGATQDLLSVYINFKSARSSMNRVLEVLDATEVVAERPGARVLTRAQGAIALEGVSFGYDAARPVLQDVTLQVAPGEVVALVGATGAGKSTLVGLVPRFFDPWSGRVCIDGQDVRELTVASVRAQVALVLQEPFLLPLTVAENIAYGRPGATMAEIEAAARAANAHEFIARLPAGYATVLAERGASLSGGQQQRLSIARALLKDAPILILDEPTSALDAETEGLLLDALGRLMKGRTTLIIAHRLTTIRTADRIVAMAQGRIVEQGSHDQLLAHDGVYARFHRLQFTASLGAAQ